MSDEARIQTIDMPAAQTVRKQEVHATITRACPHCGAGGDGHSHPEPWSCQQCHGLRLADEVPGDKGLLFRRLFRTK